MIRRSTSVLRDEASVRDAYAAHGAELYRLAVRSLGDAGLAEEAVQETFVRAWRASDRFDPGIGSLRTWLFAIARNVIIDLARARRARPPLAGDATGGEPATDDGLAAVLTAWQVEEGLRRLSEDHRRAIVETYYRGRPYAEVAAELRVAEGTVRTRVFYGLKALRLALEEMGWNGDA